jgi:prepilin-type N-terminal cleavage/methylation domain-containing protein
LKLICSIKHINHYKKKAFTLIELLAVMGIIALLIALGFVGLMSLRDSISAQNTAFKIRTIIRDVQNKALTVASGKEVTDSKWVYGYVLQRDDQKYNLYKVVDLVNAIPSEETNTSNLRTLWNQSSITCSEDGSTLSSFAVCNGPITSYSFDSTLDESTNCDILVTAVNNNMTLKNGNSCSIFIKQNGKTKEIKITSSGVGDIDICDPQCTQ